MMVLGGGLFEKIIRFRWSHEALPYREDRTYSLCACHVSTQQDGGQERDFRMKPILPVP